MKCPFCEHENCLTCWKCGRKQPEPTERGLRVVAEGDKVILRVDGQPVQTFVDWSDLHSFINQLDDAGNDAFGIDYSLPWYDE